ELSIKKPGRPWAALLSDVTPEFRIVSGFRRMSNQQLQPLRGLNVEITPQIIAEKKWDAFWDAPLDLNPEAGRGRGGHPPPAAGVAGQPGLPRKAEEVTRAAAGFHTTGGAANEQPVALKSSNRLLIAERGAAGSLAVFPPPHSFFWARELATNLGYTWYRKDSDRSFSLGIRQAEREEAEQYQANFALYS